MTLAVITPSYRNDWPLFTDLHQSVLLHTDESVKHYVVVPDADMRLFSQVAGPRCVVLAEESLYPHHYRSVRAVNRLMHFMPRIPPSARIAAVNLKRPFRPVRGWVMQQALKMEACRRIDADILLLLDSDVLLVKPVTAAILCSGGRPRFYRRPAAVDSNLPRHIQWHAVSRKLLGLPAMKLPAPDYVSSFNVWDPEVLRAMLGQVERVTGRHWMDAVTSQPSFSEWTLYGVYVEEFVPLVADSASELSLCHSYWDPIPLTPERATEFVTSVGPDDVAILIQSKSRTPLTVRHEAMHALDFAG
jgi:Family of unknown function (DUF6492)